MEYSRLPNQQDYETKRILVFKISHELIDLEHDKIERLH